MSTYLVTWAVGDFAFKTNSSGVPVFRVVTRPSEIDTAEIGKYKILIRKKNAHSNLN